MNDLPYYALSALAVLITLTVHEYAHAYAAYKMGDPTAKNLGRLSLNPLKHLDPVGAICMIFFHFGWAKPVPINARNFKNPRRGFAISALAGPLINLMISFFTAPVFLIFQKALINLLARSTPAVFAFNVTYNAMQFFYIFHVVNLGIAIFNLIPVPPLDGSRILYVFLPPKYYFGVMKYERYIALGIMLLLLIGVLDPLLSFVTGGIMNLFFLLLGL